MPTSGTFLIDAWFLTNHVRRMFLLWREDVKEVSSKVRGCGWHLGILNTISLWFVWDSLLRVFIVVLESDTGSNPSSTTYY